MVPLAFFTSACIVKYAGADLYGHTHTRVVSGSSITEFLQYTVELLNFYLISLVLLEGKFIIGIFRENSEKCIKDEAVGQKTKY